MKGKIFAATAAVIIGLGLAGCKDELGIDVESDENLDGMSFSLNVVEQSDLLMEIGKARKAAGKMPYDSATVAANAFGSHPLSGDAEGMNIHRMVLPLMGIHPHTASGGKRTTGSPMTRAGLDELVEAGDNPLTFHDSLTIWGDAYTSTSYGRQLFKQILAKKIRGWRTSVHWPYDVAGGKMKFFAISPALEDLDMTVTNPDYNTTSHMMTAPTFKYTVPDDPRGQRDVLYGESDEIDIDAGPSNTDIKYPDGSTEKEQHLGLDDKIVNLKFKHILTAVRFAQGNIPTDITIKRIEITHINNVGTYEPENGTGTWTGLSGAAAYTIYPNSKVENYGGNVYIDGDSVLFLMPQTLGADSQLRLTIQKGTETTTRTLTASLTSDIWSPGYSVTYKVTIGQLKGDYYLVVAPSSDYSTSNEVSGVPEKGGVYGTNFMDAYRQGSKSYEHSDANFKNFKIHSFRNIVNYSTNSNGINEHTAVDWILEGFAESSDATTWSLLNTGPGKWLASFTGWDRGGEKATAQSGTTGTAGDISYSFNAQTPTATINHINNIRGNTPAVNINLSNTRPNGGSASGESLSSQPIYTTANSYIVNSEGTYKFPIVYGNAYENGTEKTYASGNLNPNDIFLDHAGNVIKHADILTQINSTLTNTTEAGTPTTEESNDQVTRVEIETQYSYLRTNLSAKLLWQDVSGLITLSGDGITDKPTGSSCEFIGFTVNNSVLQPGNAVIGLYGKKHKTESRHIYKQRQKVDESNNLVYDESNNPVYEEYEFKDKIVETQYPTTSSTLETEELLWSWHIWVTDEVYPNANWQTVDIHYPSYYNGSKIVTLTDINGNSTGQILPVNLGWVPDANEWNKYDPHEVWVKIVQTEKAASAENPETIYLKLRQEATQELITGTSTVYQWGRPTALPMVMKTIKVKEGGTEYYPTRTIYDASGTDITSNFKIKKEITNFVPAAIANYDKLMTVGDSYSWWDENHNYLFWNTTKTLYDPCPPGFQMPQKNIFDVMVIGNSVAYDTPYQGLDQLNMWDKAAADNKGGYFYAIKHNSAVTEIDRYKQVFYVPTTGYYSANNSDGTLMSVQQKDQSVGYFWLSDHNTNRVGSSVYFQPKGTISNAVLKFVTEQNHDARPVRPYSPVP